MEQNPIRAYKGFDKSLCCRGFQYEVGKEYEHPGEVRACQSGFHACENPFDVFGYYPPCDDNGCQRRYCEVEQSGTLDQSEDDKVCSSRLRVVAEIGLDGIIKAGEKFILDKVNWKDKKESNTGNRSAATNTGDQSAATNTGDWSAATNTGSRSAATVEGEESIAIVTGRGSRAKGAQGCWLVLTERDSEWHILGVKAVKVDGDVVKPDKWYALENGEVVEVKDSDDD